MEARFAQKFLKIRNLVTNLCLEVDQLSKDAHVAVEGLADIQAGLSRPLRIVSFGDSNSGRSVFIDTILGVKAASHFKAKKWSGVYFAEQERELGIEIPVKHLPHASLKDYLCIQAPPCEVLASSEPGEVDQWIGGSDLVFWVLSVENPWSNTIWEILEKQSPSVLSRSVLVLTKTDLRTEGEMKITQGHLASLMQQRLQQPMPFYYTAKSGELEAGYSDAWEQAHMLLENSTENNHYLDQCREKLHRVLELIEDTLDKRARSLDSDKGFLSSVEADIDRQRERELRLYAGQGVNLGKEYVDQIDTAVSQFYKASGVISSTVDLFKRGVVAVAVETCFLQEVAEQFSRRSKSDCMQILYDCREQWRSRQQHLDERLGDDAGGFQQEPFKQLIEEIIPKLQKSTKVAILSIKIRSRLEKMLAPRREKLKKVMLVFLSLLILSGILGALQVPPYSYPAWIGIGLSFIVLVFYIITVYSTRGTVAKELNECIYDNRVKFSEDMDEVYHDMICYFFTGYAPMFESMRKKIVDAKGNLEPLQKRHHHEFLKLIAMENEYGLN